ncbi:MAG: CoA transferase [Gammaproteobacteria bacterium]|nr:CoA transferase [Gammaproteobacteria bacterium]
MGYVDGHSRYPLAVPSAVKPLTGLRVIDAGNMVAAPFATVLMADFGAEVIKIEHPEHGDGQRGLKPFKDGVPLWWKNIARNKQCITLNLGRPEGAGGCFATSSPMPTWWWRTTGPVPSSAGASAGTPCARSTSGW